MDIRFYNTLTHQLERFEPIDPPDVYMYNCGPTVYDFAHIGNFRTFMFADVLRRFLELAGYNVHQVMNITDVGHMTEDQLADGAGQDKMAVAMQRMKEAKKAGTLTAEEVSDPNDPYQIAEYYTQAFINDAKALRMKVADEPEHLPRATQHIDAMLKIVKKLVDEGKAYVADDGAVYFSVEQFPEYGTLSGNTLDKLRGGAGGRVQDEHQAGKRHPADFLLWKPDPRHVMKWDSPFGEGYPGWHIECSAMAMHVHGREMIDIHTGGEDNIFPHHECEIAQSRSYSGKSHFARYWLHARLMFVEGKKMSKSLGNFHTVRDVLEGRVTGRPVDPAVLRYELLRAHYRTNFNFIAKGLKEDAAGAVQKIRDAAMQLEQRSGGAVTDVGLDHPAVARFAEALADDLNTAGALGELFEFLRESHADPAEALGALRKMDTVLALLPQEEDREDKIKLRFSGMREQSDREGAFPDAAEITVSAACRELDKARKAKDYATADRIRTELQDAGFDVKTTKEGTVATKKLA
ncbi:MAG: cysteine--tRNA ligase [bacterium]